MTEGELSRVRSQVAHWVGTVLAGHYTHWPEELPDQVAQALIREGLVTVDAAALATQVRRLEMRERAASAASLEAEQKQLRLQAQLLSAQAQLRREESRRLQQRLDELFPLRAARERLVRLPELLRAARARENLSLRAAAAQIGCSYSTLRRVETGRRVDRALHNAIAILRWLHELEANEATPEPGEEE